jgi:hypothetical protein
MRGRKRRKRKKSREPVLGAVLSSPFSRGALVLQLLMETSPRRDVEGDGDGSVSWPCSLLVPRPGVVSRLRRPVSPWSTLRATWAPRHGRSRLRVVSRHAHSCPVSEVWLRSWAYMSVVVNEAWASVVFAPPPEGGRAPLGSGGTKAGRKTRNSIARSTRIDSGSARLV